MMPDSKKIQQTITTEVNELQGLLSNFQQVSGLLTLLENPDCPLFVAYVLSDGHFKYVNQGFADAMGYTKQEMYNIPWAEMMKPEEAHRVKADYYARFNSETPFLDYDTEYMRKDGSPIKLRWFTGTHNKDKMTICFVQELKD